MSSNCEINKNLYIKPIESCTFGALFRYLDNNQVTYNSNSNINTIFSSNIILREKDLNKDFRDEKNNFIYEYNLNNKKDLCFPIKPDDPNNSAYAINCVIATQNPLYSYDKEKRRCTIPYLKFSDNKLAYNTTKDYIYIKDDKKGEIKYNYVYKPVKAFCENKWYDWIIVPNYHFGNQYYKDSGEYSVNDVKKCYKPCPKNKIPYLDINNNQKCVNKKVAENGIYYNKLDYSPISLINLLGNNQENLSLLYIYINLYENDNFLKKNSTTYEFIPESLIKNNCSINFKSGKISSEEAKCAKKSYNDFSEVKIAFNEFNKIIFENIIDINNFESIINYIDNDDIITYKNKNFNEDDPNLITLRGLISNNMITDAILIHSFILSYKINDFMENEIIKFSNYYKSDSTDIDSNINILKKNKYNVNEILNSILIKNDRYNNDINDELRNKYKERLANILYKSINLCYDNQSQFSKNILLKTKEAFDKLKNNTESNSEFKKNLYKLKKINEKSYNEDENTIYSIADDTVTGFNTATTINEENTFLQLMLNTINDGIKIKLYPDKSNVNDITEIIDKIVYPADFTEQSKKDKIKNYVISYPFYKLETLEDNTRCKYDYIYNIDRKQCIECNTYCTTIPNGTCITDERCKLYCSSVCNPINNEDEIIGSTACGDIKRINEKDLERKSISKTRLDETPLGEDEYNFFNQFNGSIKSVLGIIFILIIIYIFYIFNQVFGEAILTFLNFISYYFILIFYIIRYWFNWAKIDFAMADYVKYVNIRKYDKVYINLFSNI